MVRVSIVQQFISIFLSFDSSALPFILCINSTEEAKKLRDVRRSEEAQQLAEAEAIAQQEAEEEERKSLLEDVKKEAEAKPGMIWNPNLREYQYLHDHTEESWRD